MKTGLKSIFKTLFGMAAATTLATVAIANTSMQDNLVPVSIGSTPYHKKPMTKKQMRNRMRSKIGRKTRKFNMLHG